MENDGAGSSSAGVGRVPQLTVVMPCLNEADTLATCIEKAQRAGASAGIDLEIVVADNGSSDESPLIAQRLGARVVTIHEPGYGSALMGGIEAARAPFILMADADDSYNFLELPRFFDRLREGYDLVQGCRLPSGGGRVLPGAMPFLHRWVGNPVLSSLVRTMFGSRVRDVYCGMRALTRRLYDELDLRSTGMEFATEMIIKASLAHKKVAEIPITLHPDGRRAHAPHLKTFRDGWRTVRFFLMCSPRWLFLIPGLVMILAGFAGYALVMPRLEVLGVSPDANTLVVASLAVLLGHQALLFAIFSKTFAISEGLLPRDPRMDRFFALFSLEKGIVLSLLALFLGLGLIATAAVRWQGQGFGPLDYSQTMRWVVPGATLTALGAQTLLASFFVSILGIRRR